MPKKIDNPKETIFDCAKQILMEDGYAQLNVRTIAKKCGVSVGTVYNYFEDKRVLDMMLMQSFWGEFEGVVVKIFDDTSQDLFYKLRETQQELNRFVTKFLELFSEVFKTRKSSYTSREKEVKGILIQRLSLLIEKEILLYAPHTAIASPNAKDISDWILLSMMMISHMGGMDYDQLEKFIKKMIL